MNDITYFAKTNFRNQAQVFGIRQNDRLLHTYIIGKTGTGKTTLLETMIKQDIKAGHGLCLLDPHGDLVQHIHASLPLERQGDVIYLDIPDQHLKFRYNPFKRVSAEKRSLVASGVLEVFKKLWSDAWGVKLEHILRCCILTLLDQPTATLADISSLLLDKAFRQNAVKFVDIPTIQKFWQKEFVAYTRLDILPVLNKIGGMLAHPVIRRILIENPDELFLRQAMDTGKIILVNLSKGKLGEDVSHLLGALFVSSLSSAAFSRADIPEENRRPFMAYFDEFHNFTTLSLVTMFAELRKFKVGLTLAHQYINQLDDDIRQAIFGNVGTIVSFRIGTEDARLLSKEMYPMFQVEDFINLPNYSIYLKLMIDGVPSKPFSANTIRSLD